MPPRAERLLHLVIAIAAGAWLVLRAACVPLTHDEAATFQTYVLTGVYLPWQAHLDAGNHLLASAATRISYLLFGDGPLALRLFSVLAFGLWAWYAWRITRGMASAALRIAASCALLLTPFVFEFFALFRGYGPALAFLLMALHHAMAYWHRAQRIDLLLALLAASIATAASLNMLVIGAMLFGMAALRTGMSRQRDAVAWATLVLVGALPLVALAQYGAELAAQDLLYYGSADGIVHGTLASLGAWVMGLRWPLASAALFVLPLLLAAFSLRSSPNRHVLAMLMLLFAGELLARWVLATGRGVLYPTDRTAMHLVPLAILLFAYAADSARSRDHARSCCGHACPIAVPRVAPHESRSHEFLARAGDYQEPVRCR
ncbi:MAG: glycosyltransferase family 39 protein [Flavobacteriales bacterium]|nr:glycosyltransferase family 39 protein [Flavobacteriales bacterium]